MDLNIQLLFGKLLQEINRKLNSGSKMDSVLDFIFDSLDVIIPYDRIGIALVDERETFVHLKWVRAKIPIQHLRLGFSAPLAGSSLQDILKTGQPRIINDLTEYLNQHPQSESTKLAMKDGVRSSLTCPLRSNGRSIGFVFFSSRKPQTYNSEHVETFLDIAEELAVIVEHGRLQNFFEVNKSKAQTLGMVLHDLKSPLGIIQGFIEASLDESWYKELSNEGRDIFSVLQRNTQFMFGLLNELSEMSQIDRQGMMLRKQEVDLLPFLSDVICNGNLLSERKEIQFRGYLAPDLPEKFFFDPDKIRQVIDNLLTNAVKYSARHSSISFRVSSGYNLLEFSVEDQGQGIPQEEISKLFKEFGKTSVRPTEGEGSTGLGLSIAKKIVEQHGGEISASSTFKKGSTFTFWIPSQ